MNFKFSLIILSILCSCSSFQKDQFSEERLILRDILPEFISYSYNNKEQEAGRILLFSENSSSFKKVIKDIKLPHCKDHISSFLNYDSMMIAFQAKEDGWKIRDLDFIKDYEIVRYEPSEHDHIDSDLKPDIFSISRIYFNQEDKNKKGIVYYSFRCGMYCGFEAVFFLEKKGNAWEVTDQCEFGIP